MLAPNSTDPVFTDPRSRWGIGGILWKVALVLLCFVLVFAHLVAERQDSPNSRSRLITMASLYEDGSHKINRLADSMGDWAKASDGNYYSNKAPGAAWLGVPVFFVLDRQLNSSALEREERDLRRLMHANTFDLYLSLLLQVFPCLFLCLLIVGKAKADAWGQLFFLNSVFFGSTASLLLGSYWGHGLGALLVLAAVHALQKDRTFFGGLFLGAALLSDYSALVTIVALLIVFLSRSSIDDLAKVALGFLPGLLLFSLYHWSAFGAPWALPSRFQNPSFTSNGSEFLSRIDFETLWQITFGASRGVFVYSPWVLLLIAALVAAWKRFTLVDKKLIIGTFLSFLLLLVLNSFYVGWHGGLSPGPRYLSSILFLFPYLALVSWPKLSLSFKCLLWASLAPSLLFYVLVNRVGLLAPFDLSLWTYYWKNFLII